MSPISKIFLRYWDFLETRTKFDFGLFDLAELPFSKPELLKEILGEYAAACAASDEQYAAGLMRAAVSLAQFQIGVGKDPIYSLGRPHDKVPRDIENISDREKRDLLEGVVAARKGPRADLWDRQKAESESLVSLLLSVKELIGRWQNDDKAK